MTEIAGSDVEARNSGRGECRTLCKKGGGMSGGNMSEGEMSYTRVHISSLECEAYAHMRRRSAALITKKILAQRVRVRVLGPMIMIGSMFWP